MYKNRFFNNISNAFIKYTSFWPQTFETLDSIYSSAQLLCLVSLFDFLFYLYKIETIQRMSVYLISMINELLVIYC